MRRPKDYLKNEIIELNHIHVSWRDYALMMLNSTPNSLRDIWREKLITSIIHADFNYSIIQEGTLMALEILSSLPDDFTKSICDDYFNFDGWEKSTRISGSKRMRVKLGHYPQEAITKEAEMCLDYIIDNFRDYDYLIYNNKILSRIWDFAQKSAGNCLYPDEILTYSLDRNVDLNEYCNFIDVCEKVYEFGIPENSKFKKYYFCHKFKNWDKKNNKLLGYPFAKTNDIEYQIQNFQSVYKTILKEEITDNPSWKRICICILKNDRNFSYAGFTRTLKERQAREEAMEAFGNLKKRTTNKL